MPDACVDLIWGDGVPFVAGPDTGPMPTSIRAGETMAGVRFKPGAVGAFFGVPLTDLLDRRVPPGRPARRPRVPPRADRRPREHGGGAVARHAGGGAAPPARPSPRLRRRPGPRPRRPPPSPPP
ncbi:DUF6597 domain-containing transcriptional factor [Nonomuraea salmonea]|uniref:DUF6597 domain-containing transcriptional factor n=1 Tax=Nonomuraea salmonea TaxID=46181 RepID=UPI0031E7699A